MNHYDVIIVGAGAAGLFSAASHAPNTKGLLIEKTKTAGTKLMMAGAGQCNFTHAGDIKDFLRHYGQNGIRLRPILYQYNNLALIAFFQKHGIEPLVREDGKVFPKSLQAADIRNALIKEAITNGFSTAYETAVQHVEFDGHFYTLFCSNNREYRSKKLIIATGGCSYPKSGSDGSMFAVLQAMGIEVNAPRPALVPIFVQEYPYSELSGISFASAKVSIKDDDRTFHQTGPILFTYDSLSGPAILDISRYVRTGLSLSINYIPQGNASELIKKIKSLVSGNVKQTSTFICELFNIPKRFSDVVCHRLSLPIKAAALSGDNIKTIVDTLTNDTFSVSGLGGFQTAMVTSGGVSLDEINIKTLECKKYPRLHIIGEALDVDGDTGGYNLQFAFSSGHAAAQR